MVYSCRPDWSLIASLPQGIPLAAKLEQLQLVLKDHMQMCLTRQEYNELLEIWRNRAKIWLPQVNLMMIRHADDMEEAFEKVLVSADEDKDSANGGGPVDAAGKGNSSHP